MTRRSPRSTGRLPKDLFDYVRSGRPTTVHPPSPNPELTVTDDWPEMVPITEAELRIFEAHFGDVLDEIFGQVP